ncbi:WXG100 family type VII secretion target [Streptomyces sp. NPDC090056]|uniref:WXG100 family type VII secretion target n=1 Tax=Streptomyces sp. NPDC090056 TaxID=3365934 RepID=UPI00380217DF
MSGEFEGKSLDALYAMIAAAKPEELSGSGTALAAAVPKILAIASDLRHYISRVQWEGEGGDAFRKWGAGMVSETLVLGDFTKVVSDEMKRAGQALTEAKAAVPKPAGMCFADPEKEKARLEAEKGPKLQEAIQQLQRLSSYYETTRDRMAAERQPEFKPLTSNEYGPEREYGAGGGAGSSASSSTGTGTGSAPAGHSSSLRSAEPGTGGTDRVTPLSPPTTPNSPTTPTPTTPPTTPTLPTPPVAPPDRAVDTNLDSVTVAPEAPTRPTAQPPVLQPPTTSGPGPVLPPLAPPLVPQAGPQGGQQFGRPVVPGPTATGPVGRAPGLTGPSPLGPGPRTEGITGGRQVPGRPVAGQQMGRMPMGTVIGEERGASPYGRGAAGMHGPGGGMHGGTPVGAPGVAGRRLATQPGGTVGSAAASTTGGRAFTPGGTGLVRPPASTGPGEEERRETRNRPDYLSEDEETWTSGQRRIVPPVID